MSSKRINVSLDQELHNWAKNHIEKHGKTLSGMFNSYLRKLRQKEQERLFKQNNA